jgi:hypothetical protein
MPSLEGEVLASHSDSNSNPNVPMRALLPVLGLAATALAATLIVSSDPAQSQPGTPIMGSYSITVTNLTRGQIFSPALVATHRGSASMFHAGGAASPELQALAEDGNNALLLAQLGGDTSVFDVQSSTGMIHPGMSETIVVQADTAHPLLSVAAMMVSTNDTFVGLDASFLPLRGETVLAYAYDAGTEFNSEDCAFIPGPPCGNGGVHDPAPAEGFIYISNGLHSAAGAASVPEAEYDWTGPVASIEILRL